MIDRIIRVACLLIFICSAFSCAQSKTPEEYIRENDKKMQAILDKYGAVPIHFDLSKEEHYVIYHDYKAIYYEDFESPRKVLFEKGKRFVVKEFVPEVTYGGHINIIQRIINGDSGDMSFLDKLSGSAEPWGFINADKGNLIHIYRYEGDNYLYCINSPDTLIRINYNSIDISANYDGYIVNISNSMWEVPGFYDIFNEYSPDACSYYKQYGGMCNFTYKVGIDKNGKLHTDIPGVDNTSIMCGNVSVDDNGDFTDFGTETLYDFPVPINGIGTSEADKHYLKIVEFYHLAHQKKTISEIKKNAITLEQLSNAFKNRVKAEEYIGQQMIIVCDIDRIDRADGLFDPDGYKYKVQAFALEAWDEWLTGYDMTGYTNDDDFVDLEYPKKVIMTCTLTSGNNREFTFKDCDLILY